MFFPWCFQGEKNKGNELNMKEFKPVDKICKLYKQHADITIIEKTTHTFYLTDMSRCKGDIIYLRTSQNTKDTCNIKSNEEF